MNDIETNKYVRKVIRSGNLDALADVIGRNPGVLDAMTPFGTWLHVAADAGDLTVVKWLVDAGIDVNRRGGVTGGNAINEASLENKPEIVSYLLAKGGELDVSDPLRNPLFSAISNGGSLDVVKILLEHGIDATVMYTGEHMQDMDAHAFAIEHGKREIAAYIQDWIRKHGSRFKSNMIRLETE